MDQVLSGKWVRVCVLALACVGLFGVAGGMGTPEPHARLLDAIEHVESGGDPAAVGDGGRSIGPYQIQRAYWQDALEHSPGIGGTYSDVKDREYARRVVRAYWSRYAPKGATNEQLARIHNGGPKGHRKAATRPYWAKVRARMEGGVK